MNIACGVDLVYLPRFRRSLKRGGENFLRRVFHEQELKNLEGETVHLAGIFAAKEAVIKALNLPVDCWLDIEITNEPNGQPQVKMSNVKCQMSNVSLSISHDGSYVIAQFVAMLKK